MNHPTYMFQLVGVYCTKFRRYCEDLRHSHPSPQKLDDSHLVEASESALAESYEVNVEENQNRSLARQ